jgi:hypothetical protein
MEASNLEPFSVKAEFEAPATRFLTLEVEANTE